MSSCYNNMAYFLKRDYKFMNSFRFIRSVGVPVKHISGN